MSEQMLEANADGNRDRSILNPKLYRDLGRQRINPDAISSAEIKNHDRYFIGGIATERHFIQDTTSRRCCT